MRSVGKVTETMIAINKKRNKTEALVLKAQKSV